MNEKIDPLINKMFFNKYKLEKKLGEGSFGLIYQAYLINENNEKEKYALKLENKKTGQNLLENEAYIMSYLKGRKNNINKY
jgi:serine/threonine protein kinase